MSKFIDTYPEDYWDLELPVNGSHDSFFSGVGFLFNSFESGDLLRQAKLPEDWTFEKLKEGRGYLLDERNSKIIWNN